MRLEQDRPRFARGSFRCTAVLVLSLVGCASLGDDLRQADALYREARYEDAEAWTAALMIERESMTPTQRLWFEYLRGMCAFRLGRDDDALHYLLLADELARRQPDGLSDHDRGLLERSLEERIAVLRE